METRLKKCTCCQNVFPMTSEYFALKYHKSRGKSYYEGKCRCCLRDYEVNYRKNNPGKFKKQDRTYNLTPKGIYKKLKQSSRGELVVISQEDFVEWYQAQPKKCFYCGIEEKDLPILTDSINSRSKRLSIDKIDSSRKYEKDNLVLCCLRCNLIKGDFFTQSEMVEIGQKYIARRWEDGTRH